MSVLIEAITLVVRRTSLDQSWPGGADAMVDWLARDDMGARWVISDEHLVAASFMSDELDDVLHALEERGLLIVTEDEDGACMYEEVAIVHGLLGIAEACDWLEWDRPDTGQPYSVCWLAGTDPGTLAVPEGHEPGCDSPFAEYFRWIPSMIHLGREGRAENWLDTDTARMHRLPHQPMFSEPGPVMRPLQYGLLGSSRMSDVRLTDGDAEELHARLWCGGFPCDFRIRAYEAQSRFRVTLFWSLDIPEQQRADLAAEVGEEPDRYFDAERGCPAARMLVLCEDLPTEAMVDDILDAMLDIMLDIQTQLVELSGTPDFAWLRPVLRLPSSEASRGRSHRGPMPPGGASD